MRLVGKIDQVPAAQQRPIFICPAVQAVVETIPVTGTAQGALTNTSSTVQSLFGTSPAASATIVVGDTLLIGYAANLNAGDSVIDLSNSGAQTAAGLSSNICMNVYAFSPDEQFVACCTCPVTPNALNSLSVRNDLISNTLTPAVPTSVVVKVVASTGTCNPATVTPANLAIGGLAWGTTLHVAPTTPVTLTPTEEEFSAAELTRITALCGFIQSNGSGFGICRTCRLGGQGGSAQR